MILPLLAAVLTAATPAPPHTLALAAGYKAAFLCSDIFTAGRTEAEATADDLTGIYPEYQPLIGGLPAVIDRQRKTVSVAFDAKLPPRIAAWRPLVGCAQLPIGADPADANALPAVDLAAPDLAKGDARAWPLGDKGGTLPSRTNLDAVVAQAFDHASFGAQNETTAVIVLIDGKIAAEKYRWDFGPHVPQRTWSVAKSLTATLVGRATQLGKVVPSDRAMVPEWSALVDQRVRITLDQLLRMNSGLWTQGPGNRTDEIYIGGQTVAQDVATRPLEALPGSRFRYANLDMLLAAYSLRTTLGPQAAAFPFRELLWPLGMTRTTLETDWQGSYILSSQVWMTARDMARLALLYQRDGLSDGARLLPEGWVKYATTPGGPQPDSAATGGAGYGAGLWLHGPGDGVPAGTYAMEGNRGQYAVIVPAAGVVVIRRGFDAPAARFDAMKFTAAVLAAVRPGTRTR